MANPYNINQPVPKHVYLQLWNEAKQVDHTDFWEKLIWEFGYQIDKKFIDNLALSTQIVVKKSKMLYLHGYILYAALCKYLENISTSTKNNKKSIFILETGTARGFSSICMAKAVKDMDSKGEIHTIDLLPHDEKIYWNCIHDNEGKKTRNELLQEWKNLRSYITFHSGKTNHQLEKISSIKRINFAFLDAQHDYLSLMQELQFVASRQKKGDVIICDDYTYYYSGKIQFPGINQAIQEFVIPNKEYSYVRKVFYGDDGEKKRGYVYLERDS